MQIGRMVKFETGRGSLYGEMDRPRSRNARVERSSYLPVTTAVAKIIRVVDPAEDPKSR